MLLKTSEMTPRQALLGVLVLSLTAKTDEQCAMAGELADDLAANVSEADIEKCKTLALQVADEIHKDPENFSVLLDSAQRCLEIVGSL